MDQNSAMTLFKKLYLTRKGADKIFIEATDKEQESDAAEASSKTNDKTATEQEQSLSDANAMLVEGSANFDIEEAQFQTLLMGIEIDKLKEGLTAISKDKAQEYLKNVSH